MTIHITPQERMKILSYLRQIAHDFSDKHNNAEFAAHHLGGHPGLSRSEKIAKWAKIPELRCLFDKYINDGESVDSAFQKASEKLGHLLNEALLHQGKPEFERTNEPWRAHYRRLS